MRAALGELQARAHHQVLDRARHDHLSRPGRGHHGRGDVQGHAARAAARDLALAGVDPGPDPQAEVEELIADLQSAPNRAGRAVEDGRDALLSGLDLAAGVSREGFPHHRVVPVDQVGPLLAAKPHRMRAGLGDLGAEDGRQHRFGGGAAPGPGQEFLDLPEHQVGIAEIWPVVDRVELHHPRPGNVLGDVAARLDGGDLVLVGVDDQRRHPDRRKDVADVDQSVHAQQVPGVAGTRAHLREFAPPCRHFRVGQLAWRIGIHAGARAPDLRHPGRPFLEFRGGHAPREAGTLQARRVAAVDDQGGGPLRIGGREQRGHHAAFRDAHHRGSLRSDRVQHRADIVHPLLQGRQGVDPVRHAGAALVEEDEA